MLAQPLPTETPADDVVAPAASAVFLVDRGLRIEFAGGAALTEAGRDADALVGRRIDDVFPAETAASLVPRYRAALAGERQTFELRRGRRVFSIEILPRTDAVGSITGAHVLALDVTEQKRLEEHLRETQRLEGLGVLAGGIAHDFNNLLVGVLGNASLALSELPDDAPARRRVETIELAARRGAALTRRLLAYCGRGTIARESVDLGRETAELLRLLVGVLPEHAEIRLELADDLPAIEGDANQVRQVLMNVITNAAEAVDPGGRVVVRTAAVHADRAYLSSFRLAEALPEGDYVALEVSDDGVGIDAEIVARMFDPFFTTKLAGRGLGLAAVLGIVRDHLGAVRVRTAPGAGTTFEVLFPAG